MKKTITTTLFLLLSIYLVKAQKGYTEVDITPGFQSVSSVMSDICFDDNDDVWMSFARKYPLSTIQSNGIAKWDGTTLTKYSSSGGVLISNAVYAIATSEFYVWVGTDKGLQRLSKANNITTSKIYHPSLTQKGLGQRVIMLKKEGDFLWIGSDDGVGKLDITNDSFTYYGGALWGKPNARVYSFTKGDNGDLWFGTDGGIVKMSANKIFTVYDEQNSGLVNNNVYTLLWKKSTGELWAGSDVGVKNGENYFGLSMLKNGVVTPVNEIDGCMSKSVRKIPSRVFHLEEESNYGNIIISMSKASFVFTNNEIAFMRIGNKNKMVKHFIKSSINNSYVKSLFLKKMPLSKKLWGGVYTGNAFIIKDVAEAVNDDNKLGELINSDPKKVDINQVSAMVLNHGDMFWDLNSNSKYEVPKNSCKSPIFASSLWMGGIDQGKNLHTAAMTYRQRGSDYFSGPIDTTYNFPPSWGDSSYFKIWKINRWDIEEFKKAFANGTLANGSYTAPDDFITWPAHGKGNYTYNLAPFIDVDNNGKYEPLKGDYPNVKGDQALFWVFNDASNLHGETQGLALGVEVRAMAYAYNCDSIKKGSPNEALNYTTFYEYEIVNRSTNKYDSTYFGVWTDVDLGNYADDYIGSDPQNNFAFVYNGDNDDEGTAGYGTNPPMLSVVMLSDKMSNFMSYNNDLSAAGNPINTEHYYNYLKSTWRDGTHLTEGGNGYNTGAPTNFAFSGTPYTSGVWNEANAGSLPSDRRFLQSVGPYTFEPNQTRKLEYAIVYSHEPDAPNGLTTSWAKNLRDVKAVQGWHTNNSFPSCPTKPLGLSIGSELENPLQEIKVVPNPFSGSTSLVFNLSQETKGTIQVYNMLGQVVQNIPLTQYNSGENTVKLDIANQPTGMYMYVLKTEGGQYTGKMINTNR